MATRQKRSTQADGDSDEESFTYTVADDERLSEAVIAALREAAGVDRHNVGVLTPLFETIDPDALNALFSSTECGTPPPGTVPFTHDASEVTVSAAGEVVVSDP